MKVKRKLGMGIRRSKRSAVKIKRKQRKRKPSVALRSGVVLKAKESLKRFKNLNNNLVEGANIALQAARAAVKSVGGRKRVRISRIVPVPKKGGILPLLPIFAGLSALGKIDSYEKTC